MRGGGIPNSSREGASRSTRRESGRGPAVPCRIRPRTSAHRRQPRPAAGACHSAVSAPTTTMPLLLLWRHPEDAGVRDLHECCVEAERRTVVRVALVPSGRPSPAGSGRPSRPPSGRPPRHSPASAADWRVPWHSRDHPARPARLPDSCCRPLPFTELHCFGSRALFVLELLGRPNGWKSE